MRLFLGEGLVLVAARCYSQIGNPCASTRVISCVNLEGEGLALLQLDEEVECLGLLTIFTINCRCAIGLLEGKQVLLRNLYLSDIKMRKEVFKAVSNSKIIWVSRMRKKILTQGIIQDVAWWHQLHQFVLKCQQSPTPLLGDTFSSLKRSFIEMGQDLRELILMQLILLQPNTLVRKTISILQDKPSQRYISAAGILQDLFSQKLYQKVQPVLLAPLITKEEKPQLMDVEEARTFLEQLIVNPSIPTDRWIMTNALDGLQKVGNEHTLFVLDKAFSNPSPLVLEAALNLLTHLKRGKKDQEKYLGKQLHKVPKNFVLEDYLNHRRKQ